MTPPAITDRLRAWATAHPRSVLFDEGAATLLDVASGKALRLAPGRWAAVRDAVNRDNGAGYLVLVRDDGFELAVAEPGICFPLDTTHAGPLPGAPPAVCFADFAQAMTRLRHQLADHPDAPLTRDTLAHVAFGIALLDGARKAGFEVGEEERELEALLGEIERRGGSPE